MARAFTIDHNSQVNFLSKSHTAFNRRHPSEEVVPPTLFHHCTMKVLVLLVAPALAFLPSSRNPTLTNRVRLNADVTTELEPKEVVKLFGRLAEKYIMLDDSGGMCCYSGCSDCEFRLPGGGYRMADQSSSRPKWIPVYEARKFEALEKEHVTKWSSQIFSEGPAVDKTTFLSKIAEMDFVPPLGGPYLSASAGTIENTAAVEALFDVLAGEKEKLTRHRMSMRLKELADGEEGVTWGMFESALRARR